MNTQILFNSALAFIMAGLIFLYNGLFLLGFFSLVIAIVTSIIWLMSGFFGKFEYSSTESKGEDEKGEVA